ncbi:MAG: hypothetical protein P8L47_03355 [Candidatus Marinamargulisbacteria bacterium]|nr:hypothetical protein [Candidatus Marinamargulisbacteria bacterium]
MGTVKSIAFFSHIFFLLLNVNPIYSFEPLSESALSRIEFVETLSPLLPVNQSLAEDHTKRYTDIDHLSSHQQLALNGYLTQANTHGGTTASLFSPDMAATRAQAAVMIHRMLSATNPQWDAGVTRSITLIDATTVSWAKKALNELANAAIIQPVGPGYTFPKRAIDAKTAEKWVQSAQAWAKTPSAGMNAAEAVERVGPPRAVSPDSVVTEPVPPTVSIALDTIEPDMIEPELPTESLEVVPTESLEVVPTEFLEAVPTPSVSTEARNATRNYQWQIRAYGGFALGDSPYQSNQPPAAVVEERYIDVIAMSHTNRRDHGSIEAKRVYGIEGGVELNRRRIGKSLWLVTNYGRHIVSESTPATVINVPNVYISQLGSEGLEITYKTNMFHNKYKTINLPEATVRKSAHTLRVGLRGPVYEKITPVATINGYLGGGLAISASTISGTAIELPKQNIKTYDQNVSGDNDKEADSVIPETIRRFHYTQNQVSVYGELGIMATRKAIHVGIQARFQENPGELSVDEKGRKRLTKERTLTGTIFSGITF